MGYISFDNGYLDYLRVADMYIDSYPFAGGITSMDTIVSGTPIISLKI